MDHLRSIFQKNKNLLVFCCCLFLLLCPFSAAATGMRPHPIRVGYTDSPGFIEKTAAGTVDGYGVAYLNEISHYTGWRYEYVYATWQECLERLAKGELDLLGMAQYTPERAASYEFASLPSGVEYMVMYVRNDDNEVYYNDYQSFNGLRIGVLKGNFQTEILSDVARKNTFTYQPVLFDSSKAMVEALQNKQIDAVVTGSMPLYKDLRLVARFQADPIYFITTKGNKAVLQRLNDALMNIHANTPEFENTTYAAYYEQSSLLTLPYAEELAEKDSTTAEQNLHGLHLLLAEDNPLNQELCLELLKSRGISSDCAVNGKEALELFTNSAPGTYALILMDIQMPVLDGYQTTQAIRSSTHPQAQTIPIISLSADAFTEDIRRAYASGMNDHVSKPIVPEELFAAITRVLKTLN